MNDAGHSDSSITVHQVLDMIRSYGNRVLTTNRTDADTYLGVINAALTRLVEQGSDAPDAERTPKGFTLAQTFRTLADLQQYIDRSTGRDSPLADLHVASLQGVRADLVTQINETLAGGDGVEQPAPQVPSATQLMEDIDAYAEAYGEARAQDLRDRVAGSVADLMAAADTAKG